MIDPIIKAYCEEDVVDIRGFDRNELVDLDEGRFVMRAYPGPDCGNNIGTVHGGYLAALIDIAGTGAIDSLGRENATTSINTSFLRPALVDDEYIEVTGTVLRAGRRTAVSEVEIRRPNGDLVAKATLQAFVFDSPIVEVERFQHLKA